MVKLLENTFRAVNIGMVNELALMCRSLDIDVWEVIDAAKTKPFGFMPFYPGPGLGGHCIPIDPFYLSWKARQNGFESRFIELAGHINAGMPRFVVERVGEALNSVASRCAGRACTCSAWPTSTMSTTARESPAIDVAQLLLRAGAKVSYSDPFVPSLDHGDVKLEAIPVDRGACRRHRLRRDHDQSQGVRLRRHRRASAARGGHAQRAEGRQRADISSSSRLSISMSQTRPHHRHHGPGRLLSGRAPAREGLRSRRRRPSDQRARISGGSSTCSIASR